MRRALTSLALLLAGCDPTPNIPKEPQEAAQTEPTPSPATQPEPSQATVPAAPVAPVARETVAEVAECWDDYCPCDTSDPDYGYFDEPLCRKIRMGMRVSDDEFYIGAGGRDARRALREFERDNP